MYKLESVSEPHHWLRKKLPSFESFSVLTKENRNLVLEVKEIFLIMRDKRCLNKKH